MKTKECYETHKTCNGSSCDQMTKAVLINAGLVEQTPAHLLRWVGPVVEGKAGV